MKVAIMYDERDCWYYAHRYNWMFRLFGASVLTHFCLHLTEEDLINDVKRRIKGKLKLIRIVEI